MEIEGQGSYEIADGFRAYKTYGNIESKTLYDMVVGYDVQKFLIEDGKLCAVLIDRNFVAQNIRVVLKTNGFQDIYHDSVRNISLPMERRRRNSLPERNLPLRRTVNIWKRAV